MKWTRNPSGCWVMQAPHGEYKASPVTGPGGGKYWVVTLNGLRIVGHTHRTLAEAKRRAQDHNMDTDTGPCNGPCGGQPATMRGGLCHDCWAESGGTMRYVGGEA